MDPFPPSLPPPAARLALLAARRHPGTPEAAGAPASPAQDSVAHAGGAAPRPAAGAGAVAAGGAASPAPAGPAKSTTPQAPPESASAADGVFRFASADERDEASVRLGEAGLLVAELEGIGPSARGRIGEFIDETIERALAARGAAGPGVSLLADRDAVLGDQLFRARRVGAPGIAVVLGPLRSAAGPRGALEPADCATLRFLALATRERPVTLLLDARDRATAGYGDPVPLIELLAAGSPAWRPAATAAAANPTAAAAAATPIPATANAAPATPATANAAPPIPATPIPATANAAAAVRTAPDVRAPPANATPPPPRTHAPSPAPAIEADPAEWQKWTTQLAEARGPQPLSALERLFAQSYMPLANAIAHGLDDPRARRARDDFRDTFAAGYVDAFPTFAATTKRPRMVFDAHELAAKTARLHGARTIRLLLVDSMRWDLSRAIQGHLQSRLATRAALADELLLWSALPTTTIRQLETIGRGVEALRAPAVLDGDPEPPRERNAEHVRRIRVGPRELHKLDLVESRVHSARGELLRMLPDIAEATAQVIARYVETLAPRTLLFVFGDHGFAIDKSGLVSQGGASPEEVLVGAFALLAGDVH